MKQTYYYTANILKSTNLVESQNVVKSLTYIYNAVKDAFSLFKSNELSKKSLMVESDLSFIGNQIKEKYFEDKDYSETISQSVLQTYQKVKSLRPDVDNSFLKDVEEYILNNLGNKKFFIIEQKTKQQSNVKKSQQNLQQSATPKNYSFTGFISFIFYLFRLALTPFTWILHATTDAIVRGILAIFYPPNDPILKENISVFKRLQILLYRLFDFIKKIFFTFFKVTYNAVITIIVVILGTIFFMYSIEYFYKIMMRLHKEKQIFQEKIKSKIKKTKKGVEAGNKSEEDERIPTTTTPVHNDDSNKTSPENMGHKENFGNDENILNPSEEKKEEDKLPDVSDIFGKGLVLENSFRFYQYIDKALMWFTARINFIKNILTSNDQNIITTFVKNIVWIALLFNGVLAFLLFYMYFHKNENDELLSKI